MTLSRPNPIHHNTKSRRSTHSHSLECVCTRTSCFLIARASDRLDCDIKNLRKYFNQFPSHTNERTVVFARTRLLELHILLGRTCGREALSGSNLHRGHPSDTQNTASRTISVRHTINVSFPFVCGALSLRPFFSNVIPTGPGRPFLEPNDCRLWKRKHVFDEISSSFRLK